MSDDLKAQFEAATEAAQSLPQRPSNDELLELYGLFKQGTDGDVQGERPGFMDFKGGAKYDAWAALEGTSSEEAMQRYVDKVQKLQTKYG